jgi:hypothetical protein
MKKYGKNKMKLLSISTIIIFLFIMGCSQEPNSVGKDVLDDMDKLKTDVSTNVAVSSSGYSITSANNSTTLMIGKSNDTEASMLLQFGTFPTDTNLANSVISARIKMIPNYSFKDTAGIMNFSMHEMKRSWSESSFTSDSLAGSYESAPVNTHSFIVNSKDTLTIFPVEKNLVIGWLKGNTNNGIILIPNIASNMIFGFNTYYYSAISDARPQLEITYRASEDTADQTLSKGTIQDATIISGTRPISTSSLFYVQGGVISRGKIKFDVSNIPRGATITQAFLELKTDTLESSLSSYTDYQILIHAISNDDTIPTLSGTTALGKLSGNTFSIDLRNIVQLWVSGKPNFGIALRYYNEFTQVDRFAVHGTSAAETNRPRLKIQYTYLP